MEAFTDWFTASYEGNQMPTLDRSDLVEAFFMGHAERPAVDADLRTVLRGFDEGVFVAHLTAERLGYLAAIDRLKAHADPKVGGVVGQVAANSP